MQALRNWWRSASTRERLLRAGLPALAVLVLLVALVAWAAGSDGDDGARAADADRAELTQRDTDGDGIPDVDDPDDDGDTIPDVDDDDSDGDGIPDDEDDDLADPAVVRRRQSSGGGTAAGTSPRATNDTSPTTGRPSVSPTTAPAAPTTTTTPQSSTSETTPPEIFAAFEQGFRERCAEIWALADGDGFMWDADDDEPTPHLVEECYAEMDVDFAESYDTVADAREGGREEAEWAAELVSTTGQLRNTSGTRFFPDY